MKFRILTMTMLLSLLSQAAHASDFEVMHWWTSGGEAKALEVLKKEFKAKTGSEWKDSKIVGGGGDNALKVLKTRGLAGNPPAAVQLKGPEIQEWGKLGLLASIDSVASKQGWDQKLPGEISNIMKYNGHWVAVPFNIHRVNWVWGNAKIFSKLGLQAPDSLSSLWQAADKLKAAGILPFAHGGQDWQDLTAFEEFFLSVAGPDLYRSVLVKGDTNAVKDPKVKEVFVALEKYRSYLAKDRKGLEWDKATRLVIDGKAGMQFMGDWAKGEFMNAHLKADHDFICFPAPGSSTHVFSYNIDSFVFFETKDARIQKNQEVLADIIMGESFQKTFNIKKGSIPALPNTNIDSFEACGKTSQKAFVEASSNNGLVPSFAHKMAVAPGVVKAVTEVVVAHLNSDMKADEAVNRLASALKAAQI